MRGSLSLLVGATFASAALALGGCSGPTSHVGGDAGPSGDAPGRCDPRRGACRVTLRCDDFVCEGVRLADGEVRSEEPSWDFDVQAFLGRYLGLTASTGFCRFGPSPGTSTAEFARLRTCPATWRAAPGPREATCSAV